MRIGHLRPAVVPQVTGMAYRTGDHTFVVDPADPLVPGFVPR
jgi:proline racemase